MQQGIQALPTAPGQAAPAGAMQSPVPAMRQNQSRGNGLKVDADGQAKYLASTKEIPQLQQMLLQGGTQYPSSIILAAIGQRLQNDALHAAQKRTQAQAQNVQNQSSGTVADKLMQAANAQQAVAQQEEPTTYAAHGGEMRVQHFADGPKPTGLRYEDSIPPAYMGLRANPSATPYTSREDEDEAAAAADIAGIGKALALPLDALKWLIKGGYLDGEKKPAAKAEAKSPTRAPMYTPTTPTGFDGIAAAATGKTAGSAGSAGSGIAKPTVKPTAKPAGIAAVAEQVGPDAFDLAYGQTRAAYEQSGKLTDEQKAAQQAELEQMRSNIAAREKRAAETTDLQRRLYERTLRDTDSLGAEGLFGIAAAMGTPRVGGDWMAGLAGGASKQLANQREMRQKAEENWIKAQAAANTEQNVLDEMRLTRVQRDAAIKDGNAKLANEMNLKLAELGKQMATLRYDQQQKSIANALEERKTGASEMSARAAMAQAGKPTEAQFMRSWFEKDPEGFGRFRRAMEESRTEGSIAKSLLQEAIKNPTMMGIMKDTAPELYQLMQREIANQSVVGATPTGPVRQ